MSEIIINKPNLKNETLISKVEVSSNLKKYFKRNELVIEYDRDIKAYDSVLNIPLTATLLPLAWLTGSDIIVDSIDLQFKKAMDGLALSFKEMYNRALFSTKILSHTSPENIILPSKEEKMAILFSGGVDSTYTLIQNIEHKPDLVMIWGIDDFAYPEHSDHWDKTVETYREYAEKRNLIIHVIKTNICDILDYRRIEHRYHRELYDGRLRVALQHSLILLPITAPLSMGRFNKLLLAASFIPEVNFSLYPRASLPHLDEQIVWADLKVEHHGFIDRTEKIMSLAKYHNEESLTLRVCLRSRIKDGLLNDSICEKCLRTMVLLVLAGIDPNDCGFKLDKSTWSTMRSYWENKESITPNFTWRKIQQMIPNVIDYDLYGSKEFLEWFREFKIEISPKNWSYTDLYMRLPYPVAKQLDRVFQKIGVNVHESPYNRELV